LKNDVNVPSKSNKQKYLGKNSFLLSRLRDSEIGVLKLTDIKKRLKYLDAVTIFIKFVIGTTVHFILV
jgi:hypothetical protein